MNKNNTGLVEYCRAQLGKPYWYGTFGQKPTLALLQQKAKQYPPPRFRSYTPERVERLRGQAGKFDRVHDCVGLLKGYLWSDTHDSTPKYNPAQDVSADGLRGMCKPRKSLDRMTEIPGVLLFMPGHVGVYIGGGAAIEARGTDYGVVRTLVRERGWDAWGLCPWLNYGDALKAQQPTSRTYTVRPGDSFWKIAENQMGDGQLCETLARFNKLTLNCVIMPGQKLKIPEMGE